MHGDGRRVHSSRDGPCSLVERCSTLQRRWVEEVVESRYAGGRESAEKSHTKNFRIPLSFISDSGIIHTTIADVSPRLFPDGTELVLVRTHLRVFHPQLN